MRLPGSVSREKSCRWTACCKYMDVGIGSYVTFLYFCAHDNLPSNNLTENTDKMNDMLHSHWE